MSDLEELKKDLEELQLLHQQAAREHVKDILSVETKKLEESIKRKEKSLAATNAEVKLATERRHQVCSSSKITNYGWDQSDKFVKLYVTLKNVQSLPPENVTTRFTHKSVDLQVNSLENKNYNLTINNLMFRIVPEESKYKVKVDTVIVFLKKESSKTWQYVTETEKKSSETKTPKFDENEDPGQSLMNLMKQMYDDGDDEMKRTIAKSWCEAREKQSKGDYSLT